MKRILFFLSFSLFFFAVKAQNYKYELQLKEKLENGDSSLIFLAIERANQLSKFFPQTIFRQYYDGQTHSFKINEKNNREKFFKSLYMYFKKAADKKKILNLLEVWHTTDSLLNSLTKNENIQGEEVLYHNKVTRSLFAKYLNNSKQSWETLSTWQSYELYIDFMNFVSNLSNEKREKLFLNLKATAKKLHR